MDEEQRLEMSGKEYDPFGEWIPEYPSGMDSLDDIPSREDIIGEILDTGESMELLPDMVEEILRELEEEETAFDEEYEDPAGFDAEASRGNQNSSGSSGFGRNDPRSNDTYSKINRSVEDVKVAPEIIDRIKTEITEEIIKQGLSPEHMDVLVADRIKDRVEELKGIRANIEHYSDLYTKMSQSSNPMHLRSMTTFQLLRFEIDSACRDYVKAGGAVGKDCFIEKGVSASQIGLSLIDVMRTNALESAIIRGATGVNIGYDDIYGGITGGKSIMGKISFPFVKLADVIGEKPGSILHDIFEKMDAKPDIEKAEEKDDPDIQKDAVVSEAEAEVSMETLETETGIQSDIEQLADSTSETSVEQPEQDEQVSNENNADEVQSVSEEQKSVAEEEEKEPVSVEEEPPVNDNLEDDTYDDTDREDSKRDSDNALITADDEENDAQIEDDEDKESDDKSEDTEAESPEHITNEDGLDIHDPDELSAEAAEQNEDLEDSSDLAIEQKSDDAGETDKESADSEPADADEQAEEIVDSAVKAVEEGEPEENVLSEVSEKLADFYEKQTEDPDLSLEDIVDSIADAVHEIASVFDDPSQAADTMLEGIPDDVKEDILDRIDEVHADMTVEASGSFGNIEYDDTGKVTDKVEADAPMEQVDTSSFDMNSTVDALEDHMESAWELPEIKDVVANDPDTMLEIPSGDEFTGSIGVEDLGGASSGAVTDSGIETVPELIELFL